MQKRPKSQKNHDAHIQLCILTSPYVLFPYNKNLETSYNPDTDLRLNIKNTWLKKTHKINKCIYLIHDSKQNLEIISKVSMVVFDCLKYNKPYLWTLASDPRDTFPYL